MDDINRLCDLFVGVWDSADTAAPFGGPDYDGRDQDRNGAELHALVDVLQRESRRARWRLPRESAERRLYRAFTAFAVRALGWRRRDLEGEIAREFRDALRAFPIEARRFDARLSSADIFQAARNVVTMHCLQALLNVPVALTPAVLAYSLLYPYTDNLLDDPHLDAEGKRAFGVRLRQRLAGTAVEPVGHRESKIFALVGMIEGEYSRARFAPVFDSLLAIHEAQMRSLQLLAASPAPDDRTLVRVAVEKGGTSVLADGYLVAGSLTSTEAECIFGLGVFLQLRDDLEDVHDDAAQGLTTVFSNRGNGCLEDPTCRTLAVGEAVVQRLSCFSAERSEPVRDIAVRSLLHTVSDAAASFPSQYSPSFLQALERRSPLRFATIAAERRRLSRANGSFSGLLERWLAEHEPQESKPVRADCRGTSVGSGLQPAEQA
jgi:hypothetical protein